MKKVGLFLIVAVSFYFLLAAFIFLLFIPSSSYLGYVSLSKNFGHYVINYLVILFSASFISSAILFKLVLKLEKVTLTLFFLLIFCMPMFFKINVATLTIGVVIAFSTADATLFRWLIRKKKKSSQIAAIVLSISVLLLLSTISFLKIGDGNGNELIEAVIEDDFNQLSSLVEKGANVNSSDAALATPFMWAAFKGNLKMMKFLKNKGSYCGQTGVISLDNFEKIYISPINAAAGEGHLNAVKYLVEDCGVDVNANQISHNIFYYKNEDIVDPENLYDFIKNTNKKKLKGIRIGNYKKSEKYLKNYLGLDINKAITDYNLSLSYGIPITTYNKFPQALINRKIVTAIP